MKLFLALVNLNKKTKHSEALKLKFVVSFSGYFIIIFEEKKQILEISITWDNFNIETIAYIRAQ